MQFLRLKKYYTIDHPWNTTKAKPSPVQKTANVTVTNFDDLGMVLKYTASMTSKGLPFSKKANIWELRIYDYNLQ